MMLIGFLIDICFGWPARIYARIGHPVTWIGHLINHLDATLNKGAVSRQFLGGVVCAGLTVIAVAIPTIVIQRLLPDSVIGVIIGGIIAWPMFAVKSMHDHVKAVAVPLGQNDVIGARKAVAMIVGRNPSTLDESGVARATIESLAENTSDGIIAPVFWGVIAGLPGLAVYKAINTMDSMIGHKSDRYEFFGKAAARVDDVVNWPASRLSGVMFALAHPTTLAKSLNVIRRDAHKHRSPNAGWPESAMAGALDVRLSGPRIYEDRIADEPWLNATGQNPQTEDIEHALALYRRAMVLTALALCLLALL